jgi:ubiquinone/menaquinone biosynthesis C-methylase UbiE
MVFFPPIRLTARFYAPGKSFCLICLLICFVIGYFNSLQRFTVGVSSWKIEILSKMNKTIHRDTERTSGIFNNRSLEVDYATLVPILKEGLKVMDVGCGTGAISKGIADRVGKTGYVIGIDNTEGFIKKGKEIFQATRNLELIHADLFEFNAKEEFDLIVSARVLQWLNNPKDALTRMKSFLKPGGQLSVLDYNHSSIVWVPNPPGSMRFFYDTFLRWRTEAGMNNQMANDLYGYFSETGFRSIEVFNADEVYRKGDDDFIPKIGIWSKVAESRQMVDEGYISDELRLKAIEEYDRWIETDAELMIMKLNEVRGRR